MLTQCKAHWLGARCRHGAPANLDGSKQAQDAPQHSAHAHAGHMLKKTASLPPTTAESALHVGLIGWVPSTDTLHQLVCKLRDTCKMSLNVEHRLMLGMHTSTQAGI